MGFELSRFKIPYETGNAKGKFLAEAFVHLAGCNRFVRCPLYTNEDMLYPLSNNEVAVLKKYPWLNTKLFLYGAHQRDIVMAAKRNYGKAVLNFLTSMKSSMDKILQGDKTDYKYICMSVSSTPNTDVMVNIELIFDYECYVDNKYESGYNSEFVIPNGVFFGNEKNLKAYLQEIIKTDDCLGKFELSKHLGHLPELVNEAYNDYPDAGINRVSLYICEKPVSAYKDSKSPEINSVYSGVAVDDKSADKGLVIVYASL